jgi:hypothetical protein
MTPKRRRLRCLAPRSRSALRALPQDDLGAAAPPRLHGIPPMPTCTCKRQHAQLNSHRQTPTAGRGRGTRQFRRRRRRYRPLYLQQAIALVVAPKLPHRGRLSLSVRSSFCCNNVGAFNGSAPSSCSSSCPSSSSPLTLPRRQASPSLPCQPFPRRPRSAPR